MKSIKTAISMPEDLYQTVRDYAGDRPFSTTMCDLVRQGLGVRVIPGKTSGMMPVFNDEIAILKERIAALEKMSGIDTKYLSHFDFRVTSLEKYVKKEFEAIKTVSSVMENTVNKETVPDEISDKVQKLSHILADVTSEMNNIKRFVSIPLDPGEFSVNGRDPDLNLTAGMPDDVDQKAQTSVTPDISEPLTDSNNPPDQRMQNLAPDQRRKNLSFRKKG